MKPAPATDPYPTALEMDSKPPVPPPAASIRRQDQVLEQGAKPLQPLKMAVWKKILIWIGVLVVAAVVVILIVLRDNLDTFSGKSSKKSGAVQGWIPDDYKAVPATENFPPACNGLKNTNSNFKWGFSSAAWAIEGSTSADNKSPNIWDVWWKSDKITGTGVGDPNITAQFYRKFPEDIALMKEMGVTAFRFSISWSRMIPEGYARKDVNPLAVAYYTNVINNLTAAGITPIVTLYHNDLPQVLVATDHWAIPVSDTSPIVNDFVWYAEQCFINFGDKVKHWITFNDPNAFCELGYESAYWPPSNEGKSYDSSACKRNVILAHARTHKLYHATYDPGFDGKVGIAVTLTWAQPFRKGNESDAKAASISLEREVGWWFDALLTGTYVNATTYITKLKTAELDLVVKTLDFIGIGYYGGKWYESYNTADGKFPIHAITIDARGTVIGETLDPDWIINVPWGLQLGLRWLKARYGSYMKPVWITENGCGSENKDNVIDDQRRIQYLKDHLNAMCKAMTADNVVVNGYLAWTFTDAFEWGYGNTKRFGVVRVNFNQPDTPRTKKQSATWISSFFAAQGLSSNQ